MGGEKDRSNTTVLRPKCSGPPLDEVGTDDKATSLGQSPVSLQVCTCKFARKKEKTGGMLMIKLYVFICPI